MSDRHHERAARTVSDAPSDTRELAMHKGHACSGHADGGCCGGHGQGHEGGHGHGHGEGHCGACGDHAGHAARHGEHAAR